MVCMKRQIPKDGLHYLQALTGLSAQLDLNEESGPLRWAAVIANVSHSVCTHQNLPETVNPRQGLSKQTLLSCLLALFHVLPDRFFVFFIFSPIIFTIITTQQSVAGFPNRIFQLKPCHFRKKYT